MHPACGLFLHVPRLNPFYFRRLAELGWQVPPADFWVENVRSRGFGGTCFSINSNLHRLLTALGYDARFMRVAGGGHLSVAVTLDGRLYLTDPGMGAPLFEPVELRAPVTVERFGRGVRVYPMAGEPGAYHLDHYLDGEHKMGWTFATMPEPWEQFEPNLAASYTATGYFMRFLVCSLYQEKPARNLALRNSLFTVRLPDGSKRETVLTSVAELEAVLTEEFRLPDLPVREAVQTMASLGVDVFAPPRQ